MMNKRKNTLVFLAGILLSLAVCSPAAANRKNEITIAVPAELMAQMINDALPVEIEKRQEISGAIWLESIDELKLEAGKASFFARIRGKDLAYTGKIGKTPMTLDFGNANLAFNCDAALRYDKQTHLLFVKPEVVVEQTENESLSVLIAALVNGQEFPLEIEKIRPLSAKLGGDTLTLDMDVSNIYALKDILIIAIKPTVKKSSVSTSEQKR